ncbi:ferritin [Emticicia fluvialis]|uniref:ferritin n=1 Tax=Emticicia fluvialis TaxID=2974474 RepID=UPI002165A4B0|nr:ferritin [Emticicia fluvialis]
MKDLVRLRTSLKEEIETALNAQIKMEAEASAKYLSMGSWCERNGYIKSAEYLYRQSNEEREHMLKIFHYVASVGGTAISPAVETPQLEWGTFQSVFEAALQSEINVTHTINKLVTKCRNAEDYATENFLQWFVKEQIEEEANARRALELFDVIGTDGTGLFVVDKEIGKIGTEE